MTKPPSNPSEDPTLEPTSAELAPTYPNFPSVAERAPGWGATLDMAAPPSGQEGFEPWNIERYAAFCADRRLGDPAEIRARYGVADTDEEHALIVHMNRKLSSAPFVRERWMRLVAARLAEQGARGRA